MKDWLPNIKVLRNLPHGITQFSDIPLHQPSDHTQPVKLLSSVQILETVHILRHHVRGRGGPDTNDDINDAFRGGGVNIKMMM